MERPRRFVNLSHDTVRCPVCKVEFKYDVRVVAPSNDTTLECPNGHVVPFGDLEVVWERV